MSDERKVVWILGAGFSRPLGGPLLQYLLSDEASRDTELRFPDHRMPELDRRKMVRVRALKKSGDKEQLKLWEDAEEFLGYLDTAARSAHSVTRRRIQMMIDGIYKHLPAEPSEHVMTVEEFHVFACRMIAAECCAFLDEADPEMETWDPFRKWAQKLGEDDTVITFNYDRVIETLLATLKPPYMHVEIPGRPDDFPHGGKCGRVLKLHGSVDWRKDAPKNYSKAGELFALDCSASQMALATPGPTKRSTAKEFAGLWKMAEAAIRDADAIVFVGYRFPPSDAESRERLLTAIEENKRAALAIHVVLGPLGHDTARLQHLVTLMCDRAHRLDASRLLVPNVMPYPSVSAAIAHEKKVFTATVHPLYSQDFLTVWSREALFLR